MEAKKLVQGSDSDRKWEQMDDNILLKIFTALNIVDLAFNIPGVCQLWRKLAQEPWLWRTIDMDEIRDAYVPPNNHNWYSRDVVQKLESMLAYSRGNVTSLICSSYSPFHVSDWVRIAERTPMLRNLTFPVTEASSSSGFCEVVKQWPALKTLTASGLCWSECLVEEISKNCPQFSGLKLIDMFDQPFADDIIEFLPNLTVLSLRGSFVLVEAIEFILTKLENLEVLNISHCLIIQTSPGANDYRMLTARLKWFMACEPDCPICSQYVRHYQRSTANGYDYDQRLWKEDELSCFTS